MSDDRYDNHRYYNEDTFNIQSTAGAVPVRNKKGEISMKKVKVTRYISGKRPDYAQGSRVESSEEDESDDEDFTHQKRPRHHHHRSHEQGSPPQQHHRHRERAMDGIKEVDEEEEEEAEPDMSDPRIRRLLAARQAKGQEKDEQSDEEDRLTRHRRIHEPEVLSDDDDDQAGGSDDSDESSSGDEELDEAAVQRRRELMRQRAHAKAQIGIGQEELMDKEEEKSGSEEEEEETSEEETSDSEDDEEGAKLKPVFVRKKERLTVQEREREEAKEMELEREKQILSDHRRKDTRRLIETIVKDTAVERKSKDNDLQGMNEVDTEDENDETEYEGWKLRELKRLKRDREDKETRERDKAEVERLRNMTEDERRLELKNNPKQITNKGVKGKYKFMQKYYHRGAFFMADDENLFKRDYSGATLEDKFDKTVLPKVMQVKNFGRSGRTKYTHLVDQDTTQFDSAWTTESTQHLKFQLQHAGGMKQNFERPSTKKKK